MSDAANEVEWCVRSGIVFMHVGGFATANGKVVTGPPVRYMPKHDGYFPCFYYDSNNVMGVWVPARKENSRTCYVYDLASGAGHRVSAALSWPMEG